MHWIQFDILLTLTRSEAARYSDLKPKDVEGNLFMYHLQRLMAQGLVAKQEGLYRLTQKGLDESVSLRLNRRKRETPPQVVVAILAQHEDHIALFKWNRAPYRNQVSIPFGRVEAGISLAESVAGQLKNKTGLKTDDLVPIAVVDLRVMRQSALSRHQVVHIYRIDIPKFQQLSADGLTGQPFWGMASRVDENQWVPGFKEILHLCQNPSKTFDEVVVQL